MNSLIQQVGAKWVYDIESILKARINDKHLIIQLHELTNERKKQDDEF